MGEGAALVFLALSLVLACRWIGQALGFALSAFRTVPLRDSTLFLGAAVLRALPFAAPFAGMVLWLELTGAQIGADWHIVGVVLASLMAVHAVPYGLRGALVARSLLDDRALVWARTLGRAGGAAGILFLLVMFVLGVRGA